MSVALLSIEHSKAAYVADFALYGAAVAALTLCLRLAAPTWQAGELAAVAALGVAGWTLAEYGLHRFVLHGVQPFKRWHAEHHDRPTALICAPTLLSASLIALLVFLPVLALAGTLVAGALTLGMLTGYLAYAVTHHATHHWRADNAWLHRRKLFHARHHHGRDPGCYGVTSGFWDRVFGSRRRAALAARC
jgi:cyclopropane-fatty-acyl-phospholipid synthase